MYDYFKVMYIEKYNNTLGSTVPILQDAKLTQVQI